MEFIGGSIMITLGVIKITEDCHWWSVVAAEAWDSDQHYPRHQLLNWILYQSKTQQIQRIEAIYG